MNASERFEALAELFRRETGMLAPGKDEAAAASAHAYEERVAAWTLWLQKRAAKRAFDGAKGRGE